MIQPWHGAHIERDGAYRVDCPSLYDVYNNSNRGDIGDRFRISPVQTVLKCPVVKQYQAVINAVDVQCKRHLRELDFNVCQYRAHACRTCAKLNEQKIQVKRS